MSETVQQQQQQQWLGALQALPKAAATRGVWGSDSGGPFRLLREVSHDRCCRHGRALAKAPERLKCINLVSQPR